MMMRAAAFWPYPIVSHVYVCVCVGGGEGLPNTPQMYTIPPDADSLWMQPPPLPPADAYPLSLQR